MSPKQREQFNRMRYALKKIALGYESTAKLRRISGDGLDYEERLEYAYENIQAEAKRAARGVAEIKL